MILTAHAQSRLDERIMLSEYNVLQLLDDAVLAGEGSQKAPRWYKGDGQYREDTVWISFKDIDGIPCAAVVDTIGNRIVTVVKK